MCLRFAEWVAGIINNTGTCRGAGGCPKGDACARVYDYDTSNIDACCACILPRGHCRCFLLGGLPIATVARNEPEFHMSQFKLCVRLQHWGLCRDGGLN